MKNKTESTFLTPRRSYVLEDEEAEWLL